MQEFKKDYGLATAKISKAVEAVPHKLLIKENAIDKNLQKSSLSDTDKLKKLYKLSDELAEKISAHSHCQQGCGNCCHYNVDVLDIEAQIIQQEYGITISQVEKSSRNNQDFHGSPCSFLNDGQCRIYSARPFMCRKFVSFMPDAHWCHPEVHSDIDTPHIAFSELNIAYSRLIENHQTKDIRQWFNPSEIQKDDQPQLIPAIEIDVKYSAAM